MARRDGNFDVAAVIAGDPAGLIRDIPPFREVIDRMVRDAASLLKYGPSQVKISAA